MDIPTICRYCGGKVALTDSAEVHEESHGDIYLCRNCNAYVGVHKGTVQPKGTLANAVLRLKRREAHRAFDTLWKTNEFTRTEAYRWLAGQMGMKEQHAHIAWFEIEQCERVVRVCREFINQEAA